ncbi:SCL-interrupting locus protein homolog isoform X2 [Archocentrus centrarchus]|uniref:SCL-interrupting locus protein homolog isoform X2 n=1 Tax=Archocentrus centrarchus TaxID=63155 RepID=UPI0011EA37FB|nr:SCL-interrupting locus protein isoform X2 [Archocentrus centrarchus]
MSYPRSLQALPGGMLEVFTAESARGRNVVNSQTPLSFPKSRSALWDSNPVGEKLHLHLSSHRKPRLVLLEKALRLAHRHARRSNKPRLHCFFLGSISVDSDEEGVTITLDRFDPGRDQAGASGRVPSALLPGDVLVPCLFSTQTETVSDTVVQSETELHHCFKVLQQFVSSRQTLDLSQLLKISGHVVCSQQSDAAVFSLSWSVISPSVSVDVQPVRAVPIIPTALLRSLTSISRPLQHNSSRQRGFLTMDQTRKLLLLLESDPKASSLPLVGLWLSGVTHVYNPQVWAWCLRFMFSCTLQDRVLSESGSFLLVVFGCTHRAPQFFQCRGSGPQLDCQLLTASQTATLYQVVQVDGQTLQVELGSEDHSRQMEVFRKAQISFSSAPPLAASLSVNDQDSGVEDEDVSPRPSPSPHPPAQQARRVQPSVPELSLLIDTSFTCSPNSGLDPRSACKAPAVKRPAHPSGTSSTSSLAPRPPPHLQSTPNSNPQQLCTCCSTHPYNCTTIFASPDFHHAAASPASQHHAAASPASQHHAAASPASQHHAAASPASQHHAAASPASQHHAAASPASQHNAAASPASQHNAAASPASQHNAAASPASQHNAAASPASQHNAPSASSLDSTSPPLPSSNHPAPSLPPPSTIQFIAPSFTYPAPSTSHHHTSPPRSSNEPAPPSFNTSTVHSTCHRTPPCTLAFPPTPSFPCRHPALPESGDLPFLHHSHPAADPVSPPCLSRQSCMKCCYQAGGVVPSDTYQLLLQQDHQLRLLQAQVQLLLEAQKKLQSSSHSLGDTHKPRSMASIAVGTGASLFWGNPVQTLSHQEVQVSPPRSTPRPPPSSSSSSSSASSLSLIRPVGGAEDGVIRGHSAPCSPPGPYSSAQQSPVLGESASMYKPTDEQQSFYHNLMTQLTSRLQESDSKQEVEEESRRRSLSVVSDCSQSSRKQQQSPVEDPVVNATLQQLQQLGVHVDEDVTESGKNQRKAVETASTLASINPAAVLSRLTVSESTSSALFPAGSVDLSLEANAIALRYLSDSQLSRLSLGGHVPHSGPTSSSTSDSLLSPTNMSLATRKYMRRYGLIEEEDGQNEKAQNEVGFQETSDRQPLTEAKNVKVLPQSQLIQDLRPKMQFLVENTEPYTSNKENCSTRRPSLVRANLHQTEGSLGNILDLSRLRQLPKLF